MREDWQNIDCKNLSFYVEYLILSQKAKYQPE
jgi:hypothetical protein